MSLYNKYKNKKDTRGKQNCVIMAAMIASMDNSLGTVMDKLEELGLSEKTMVVFYMRIECRSNCATYLV